MTYRDDAIDVWGEQCMFCDATRNIQVHHIDGDRDNNYILNLVPVCRGCHNLIHSDDEKLSEWTEMLGGSRDFEKERAIGKVKMLARDYGVGFDKTRTIISDVDLQREFETDGRGRITLGPEFADSEVYVTIKKRDESGEELPEELQGLTA